MTSINATQNELVSASISKSGSRLLVIFVVLAATWRVLGLMWLEDSPLLSPDPGSKELGLLFAKGLMGLGMVVLGLLAVVRVRTRASGLFALAASSAGIYFGGPLPASSELAQDAIWLGYLVVGAMMASSTFLHFMLVYPGPLKIVRRRGSSVVLYLPTAVGAILAAWILLLSAENGPRGTLRAIFFTLESWQLTVFLATALALIPLRYLHATPADRRLLGLDLMLLGFCAGFLPWAIAMGAQRIFPSLQIPGGLGSGPFELLFIFIPMGLCSALLHRTENDLPSVQPGP